MTMTRTFAARPRTHEIQSRRDDPFHALATLAVLRRLGPPQFRHRDEAPPMLELSADCRWTAYTVKKRDKVAFVDANRTDLPAIMSRAAEANEVIRIDPDSDGVLQMRRVIAGRAGTRIVRVFVGRAESLWRLGNRVLPGHRHEVLLRALEPLRGMLIESGRIDVVGPDGAEALASI